MGFPLPVETCFQRVPVKLVNLSGDFPQLGRSSPAGLVGACAGDAVAGARFDGVLSHNLKIQNGRFDL